MPSLFDPIELGAIRAANRVFMAPLTRMRADGDHVPTAMMVDYYRQRASAGLIISEATGISRQGLGWPFTPGLYTDAQVEAWCEARRVAERCDRGLRAVDPHDHRRRARLGLGVRVGRLRVPKALGHVRILLAAEWRRKSAR